MTEAAAGNYYPLTAAMHIQDGSRQLALLTDRAQGEATLRDVAADGAARPRGTCQRAACRFACCRAGGASLRSGQVEVMLHRRTLAGGEPPLRWLSGGRRLQWKGSRWWFQPPLCSGKS